MTPATIALITLCCFILVVVMLVLWSLCVVSGRASRWEEEQQWLNE